ncbi:MAG: pyridoxal phosphate-dependent aminotransferase family protein [Myxococcales bacterium]|nr:pyridoxal phosphate-dependent aminotransferase family protein [Myxococcales bacterium]MDH5567850.1 pyridoxal phosphate-dependent aminotransferase family protein [Myxococcales bacterium]
MDIFSKCTENAERVRAARQANAYVYYRTISSAQDPLVIRKGRELVMLGSNNYLGLTSHPEVKQAAATALSRYGSGSAGSRLLNGTLDLHVELEERLADFIGREAALTFSTGFQVNLGVLSCLLGRSDVAILDSLDHACIIDGCRLGFGKTHKYRHNDMEDLERKLDNLPADRGVIIVVDGVFSMEGDLANLPRIVELKKQRSARLMVDDAHGIGVFGANGRGSAEHFGLEHEVDLVMGTFSKSLATVGGFIASDAPVIDYIKHNARSEIFSAAPPPASVAAAMKALEIVEREPERRKQLWENTDYMRRELIALGFDTGESASPVVPLVIGGDMAAFRMTVRLEEEGVFVNPVVSPAVPEGRAMIRTSYMATHEREHLDRALVAIEKVGREMGII